MPWARISALKRAGPAATAMPRVSRVVATFIEPGPGWPEASRKTSLLPSRPSSYSLARVILHNCRAEPLCANCAHVEGRDGAVETLELELAYRSGVGQRF